MYVCLYVCVYVCMFTNTNESTNNISKSGLETLARRKLIASNMSPFQNIQRGMGFESYRGKTYETTLPEYGRP